MVDYIKRYYTRVVVNHKVDSTMYRVILPVSNLDIKHELSSVSKATFEFWEPPFSINTGEFSEFAKLKQNTSTESSPYCVDLNGDSLEIYISKQEFDSSYKNYLVFYGTIYNFNIEFDNKESLIKPRYSVTAYGAGKRLEDYYRPVKLGATLTGIQLQTVLSEILSVGLATSYDDSDNIIGNIGLSKGKDIKNYHDLLQEILNDADSDFYINTFWNESTLESGIHLVSKAGKEPEFTVIPSMGVGIEYDATKILNQVTVFGAPSIQFKVRLSDNSEVDGNDATFTDGLDHSTDGRYPFVWVCNTPDTKWQPYTRKKGNQALKTWTSTAPVNDNAAWNYSDKPHTIRLEVIDANTWLFDFGEGGKMHFALKYKVPAQLEKSFPYSATLNEYELGLRIRCYCKSGGYYENLLKLTGARYRFEENEWKFDYLWSDIVVGFNLYDYTSWEAKPTNNIYPNWNEIVCIEFYPIDPFNRVDPNNHASADVWIDDFSLDNFQVMGTAYDAPSQAKYGIRNMEPLKDYELLKNEYALAVASPIVAAYKNPVINVKNVSVDPDEVFEVMHPDKQGIAKWKYALGSFVRVGFDESSTIVASSQIRSINFSSKDQMLSCSVDLGKRFIPDVSKTFRMMSSLLKRLDFDIESFKNIIVAQSVLDSPLTPSTLLDVAQDFGVELELYYQRASLFSTTANWEWTGFPTISLCDSFGYVKKGTGVCYAKHKSNTLPLNSDFWFRVDIKPEFKAGSGNIIMLAGSYYNFGAGELLETAFDGVGFLLGLDGANVKVYACQIGYGGLVPDVYSAIKNDANIIATIPNNTSIRIMFRVDYVQSKVYYYVNDLMNAVKSFDYDTQYLSSPASLCVMVMDGEMEINMYNGVLARRIY